MSHTHASFRAALAFAAYALPSTTALAGANFGLLGQIFVDPDFTGGTGPSDQTISQLTVIDTSGSATGGFGSAGSAHVRVDYGHIQLTGDASGSLNTVTRGRFFDAVTFTAPGVATGTLGSLTFGVSVTGTLSSTAGASAAGWLLQADFGGGAFDINASATQYSPTLFPGTYVGDPFGSYFATITFQYGLPTVLDVELSATADAAFSQVGGSADASFNLGNSLHWLGVTNVTAGGQPIDGVSAASASGTNWLIPAPGSGALLAVGAALATRRKR